MFLFRSNLSSSCLVLGYGPKIRPKLKSPEKYYRERLRERKTSRGAAMFSRPSTSQSSANEADEDDGESLD